MIFAAIASVYVGRQPKNTKQKTPTELQVGVNIYCWPSNLRISAPVLNRIPSNQAQMKANISGHTLLCLIDRTRNIKIALVPQISLLLLLLTRFATVLVIFHYVLCSPFDTGRRHARAAATQGINRGVHRTGREKDKRGTIERRGCSIFF